MNSVTCTQTRVVTALL
uniref:Uncharacterized protein n=1 Tax=Anguilla anguilla TaxID=7936 RepID=A0A0E9VRU7_ANGAN